MRKTIAAALMAASLLSLAGCQNKAATDDKASAGPAATGGGGIDGTWKADLATVQVDAKPDELSLKGDTFACPTCTPPYTLKADGAFHPVTGRPYADSMAVKVNDDHTVTVTSRKDGKVTGENKYSVSGDGKTLTVSFTDDTVAKPVTGSLTETRVGDPTPGAHALSGSWKMDKYDNVSDEGLTVTYKLDGDTLHMTSPVGQSFDAKLDGTAAPIKGDMAGTTASVTKTGDNTYRETDKRDGKTIATTDFTVDGDTLHVVNHDERNGSTMKYDAKRT